MEKEISNGKPKYFKVETNGEYFWTTGELLAMAQDCEKLFDNKEVDMSININGTNTLVSEVFKNTLRAKEKHYLDILHATGASKEIWNAV